MEQPAGKREGSRKSSARAAPSSARTGIGVMGLQLWILCTGAVLDLSLNTDALLK